MNDNCDDTIGFTFDMQRHKEVSRFHQPYTLFTQIYNGLSKTVQARLAQYQQFVILAQVAEAKADAPDANDNAKLSEEQYKASRSFKYESLETFFISNYLPQR